MSILKLEPNEKVLFTIAGIVEVEGNFGPQLKFTSTDDDVMFLNVDAAVRQLGRIGFTAQTAVGQTVEFERVVKDGKKFTNINKPGAQKLAAAKPDNAKQAFSSGPHIPEMDGPLPIGKLDVLFGLYSACVDHVLAVEVPKLMKADIGVSPESVSSMAATLIIQASR